jgi:hypothetical protein
MLGLRSPTLIAPPLEIHMKEALTGLFNSKKALAGIAATTASTLVVIAGQKGWVIDPDAAQLLVIAILTLAGAVIGGQGLSDMGKEKAKVEAAAAEVVASLKKKDLEV